MKTKQQLERSFDEDPFSQILVDPNKTNEPFSWCLALEDAELFDGQDGAICIPIKNYLLDRFMGTPHSMMNGECSLWVRLPLVVEKKGIELIPSIYSPELWNLQVDDSFDSNEQLLQLMAPEFLEDVTVIYPSLLNSFDKKIRFAEFGLLFYEDDDLPSPTFEDQCKLTELVADLMDRDDFVSYLLDILIPLVLIYLDDQFLGDKKWINTKRKQIKSFRETI